MKVQECPDCKKTYINDGRWDDGCPWRCGKAAPVPPEVKRKKLHADLQLLVRKAVKSSKRKGKPRSSFECMGCTKKQMTDHFESQFTEGMSWSNYGKWQIDHVVPVSWFDLHLEEHRLVCFNWLNLRPLWRSQNSARSNRATQEELERLHPDLLMLVQMLGVEKPQRRKRGMV